MKLSAFLQHPILIIYKKEFKDIVRDWRALITVSLVSILAGPILLLMISNMLANFEARAERRIIVIHGIEHAPSLANHLARETTQIEQAPDDYEQALLEGRLLDPVLVIPADFEEKWQNGIPQTVNIYTNSSNARINAGVSRVKRWVGGLAGDVASINLALKGVAPSAHDTIGIEDIDLASAQAETAKVFGMLPYFLVLAALYGIWGSALDTTVGEKERGTLEPLLILPHPASTIVWGKWLAVWSVGAIITSIAVVSFIPAQAMMNSETLRAMFAYGWREAAICLLLLIPLCGLFSAILMTVGIYAKTSRQGQANATAVLLVSTFIPLLSQLNEQTQQTWHAYAPVVAQHFHIMAILKGEYSSHLQTIYAGLIAIVLSFLIFSFGAKRITCKFN